MICTKTLPEWLTPDDLEWLKRIEAQPKDDYREMRQKVLSGEWDIWALNPPAEGLAISYPEDGRLFIHHLRGKGLFDTLTLEDLLQASRAQGLDGLTCETSKSGMVRLLGRIGWYVISHSDGVWRMELPDGRQ